MFPLFELFLTVETKNIAVLLKCSRKWIFTDLLYVNENKLEYEKINLTTKCKFNIRYPRSSSLQKTDCVSK